jgi:hypothetical protein
MDDEGHIEGWCEDCKKPCVSVTEDQGIGSYEFWGARGMHHDYVEVSPCCQAEVIEHEPCPKCGSFDTDIGLHHQGDAASPECYYNACNGCEHQWGHS